jgi:hypothetical protein
MRAARSQPQQACCIWTGGHTTVPYEQNTQQSSDRGLSSAPHPVQS